MSPLPCSSTGEGQVRLPPNLTLRITGVSQLPSFVIYTTHSVTGKSLYSIYSALTESPSEFLPSMTYCKVLQEVRRWLTLGEKSSGIPLITRYPISKRRGISSGDVNLKISLTRDISLCVMMCGDCITVPPEVFCILSYKLRLVKENNKK